MRIAIGSDHGGFELKEYLKKYLDKKGIKYKDLGTFSTKSCDYPDFGSKVGAAVGYGDFEKGLLICTTGIGMSIVANKIKGIRASLCHDVFSARYAREHNDANILTLGGRVIDSGLAKEIVKVWLNTDFSGEERHLKRLNKIKQEENKIYK